ncbi:MAG: hypothetical protein Q9M45_04010 [Robiginitomaculum sp.]|nr:hypothetical protein [Robiginitomaculum sp.]
MDNVEAKNLSEAIEKINLLGNSSLIYTGNKSFDETYIFKNFVGAVKVDYGICFSAFMANKSDPPDIFAWMGDEKINVEIRRLMNEKRMALKKAKDRNKNKKMEEVSSLEWRKHIYWSKDKFICEIEKAIETKKCNYKKNNKYMDVLLIASDEPGLSFDDAQNWVPKINKTATAWIRSAFYMSYVAGAPENDAGRWKTVKIFGDI